METTLRLNTLRHLLRRDLFMDRNRALIGFAIMAGLTLLFWFTDWYTSPNPQAFQALQIDAYRIWFIIFGTLHIGSSFREFAQVGTLQDYLLLPASTLEKWTARWVKTLPLFILGFTGAYMLLVWVLHLLLMARGVQGLTLFQPFHPEIVDTWKSYLLLHAMFFTGTIHFNRQPMQKTLFTLIVVILSFSAVTMAVMFSMLGNNQHLEGQITIDEGIFVHYESWSWILILGFAAFLWFVSYLKLTEKEV